MIDVAASLQAFHSATTSLQPVVRAAEALVGLRDESEIQAKAVELTLAVVEAQSQALAAQTAAVAQVARISELEERIAQLENWEREKRRYELTRLNPGVFVYSLKQAMGNDEPPHDICARCYEDGMKAILQPERSAEGIRLRCTRCKAEITHW